MSHSTVAEAAHSTVPTPLHFRAVNDHDNAIETSWDAVPGSGVTYTLKETESPDGVHGAIGIPGTSSRRTPHTHRVYEYWVVAVKDGHQSVDSDHVRVAFPHDAGPAEPAESSGSSTGSTPAEILKIGGVGGSWNVGIGFLPEPGQGDDEGEHQDFDDKDQFADDFTMPPYFKSTPDGRAVHFQSFVIGGRTSKRTEYTRSELRELKAGGHGHAAWKASEGPHVLSGVTAVTDLPPHKREICIAQIHDGNDRVQIRVEGDDGSGTTGFRWTVKIVDEDDNEDEKTVRTGYRLDDEVAWEIRVADNRVHVKVQGGDDRDEPLTGDGMYFKTGCYVQSRKKNKGHPDNDRLDFGACTLRDLRVRHDHG